MSETAPWERGVTRGSFLVSLSAVAACSTNPGYSGAQADIRTIESGLDLEGQMREHGVPGINAAVVRNYQIAWAKGYGVTELAGAHAVTPQTLFLAGSISKPVTAVGALALVGEGRLSLEGDVNDQLRSWRIPQHEHELQKVTLAQLLDHTAGFTGGDFFPGYAVGEPVPTLHQILDGQSPARNSAVRLGLAPGSEWHYSGDGYLVVQQLMMDATGEPFPALMRRLVFDKLAMHNSTFEQPLPADRAPLAARGTLMSGSPVQGGWHINPEMAAGGLWSTPTDLATLAIEIARTFRGIGTRRVISQRLAIEMLAPHVRNGVINILGTAGDPDAMGYGFFVGERLHRFGHIGGNVGYQATLVFFADTGDGAVIMTNSDIGLRAGNALLNAIANHYNWNYAAPPPP